MVGRRVVNKQASETMRSECYNSSDRSELVRCAELRSKTSIKKLSLAESFFMVNLKDHSNQRGNAQ